MGLYHSAEMDFVAGNILGPFWGTHPADMCCCMEDVLSLLSEGVDSMPIVWKHLLTNGTSVMLMY